MSWASLKNSFVMLIFLGISCTPAREKDRLYLASSLAVMADDLEKILSAKKLPVELVFLSSSAIAKHMEQGHVCLAAILADERWSSFVVSKGLASVSERSVAHNALVLVSNVYHPPQDFRLALNGLSANQKLIIGDPDFVPLGTYTKEALDKLNLFAPLKSRMMRAFSAKDARLLLGRRAASYAILYQTDAEKMHVIAKIDAHLHRPITYPLLRCQKGDPQKVRALEQIIFSQPFQSALKSRGFTQ